jgi:aldose 1-epimerase
VGARLPSGDQCELTAGRYRAVVTTVGATLRELHCGARPLLAGFGPGERSTSGRGQVLAPWPNRIRDGRYRFGGRQHQLPIDEPDRGNAIHGLVRWQEWRVTGRAPGTVSLGHVIWPREGYPFTVELAVTYSLDGTSGLTVRMEAANAGAQPCPFGAGFHPYVPGNPVDDLVVGCPAPTALLTDGRGIPVGRERVAGTERDFGSSRAVGATRLDTCFTDLRRDGDGRAEISVVGSVGGQAAGPDTAGRETVVWMDAAFGYVMLFTADTLPEGQRRSALAVEPMTCAPNAFRSGDGLVVLTPGERWSGEWGIRVGEG